MVEAAEAQQLIGEGQIDRACCLVDNWNAQCCSLEGASLSRRCLLACHTMCATNSTNVTLCVRIFSQCVAERAGKLRQSIEEMHGALKSAQKSESDALTASASASAIADSRYVWHVQKVCNEQCSPKEQCLGIPWLSVLSEASQLFELP
jgi:hypothetical protein